MNNYNREKQVKANNRLEYRQKFNKKWQAAVEFARNNWAELQYHASFDGGSIPIADQLEVYCNIPQFIASDIANTLSLFKQTIER